MKPLDGLTVEVSQVDGQRLITLRRGSDSVTFPGDSAADLLDAVVVAATRPWPFEAVGFGSNPNVVLGAEGASTSRRDNRRALPAPSPGPTPRGARSRERRPS